MSWTCSTVCRTSSTMRSVATWRPAAAVRNGCGSPPAGGAGGARAGGGGRGRGDQPPLLMDIFDIDGDTGDGVRLLKTALPAVVPADATPPEYGRFLPADWRDNQHTRQAVEDRMGALERAGAKLFVERLRLEWRPGTPVAQGGGQSSKSWQLTCTDYPGRTSARVYGMPAG